MPIVKVYKVLRYNDMFWTICIKECPLQELINFVPQSKIEYQYLILQSYHK